MNESKVASRGRVTLPKSVRKALGARPGGRIRYAIRGKEVWILPEKPQGK